jgi:hypothetical protein
VQWGDARDSSGKSVGTDAHPRSLALERGGVRAVRRCSPVTAVLRSPVTSLRTSCSTRRGGEREAQPKGGRRRLGVGAHQAMEASVVAARNATASVALPGPILDKKQ